MKPQNKSHITIVGAGLAGSFLSVLFAKRGYKVTVYERMTRQETLEPSKRSINISFHNYGAEALKTVGVWEEIKRGCIVLEGSVTKLPFYRPIYASFTNLNLDYYSAKREKILTALIKKAETYPNITFSFNTALLNIDRLEKKIVIKNLRSGKMSVFPVDVLIGADGVNSTVRAFLQQGQHTRHDQNQTGWEYRQVVFSPDTVRKLKFDTKRAYSSTRKEAIFVALPNQDGTFSGMLAVSAKNSFGRMDSDHTRKLFIQETFPELAPGMNEFLAALRKNPNGSFVTLKTSPWVYKDFMALVGDAGHSVTPFIGHGVTVGFGDCLTLITSVDKHGEDWKKVFAEYQENRKKHADVLVDMSLESFDNFRRERKANYPIIYSHFESLLHRIFPGIFSSSVFERVVFNPDLADTYMQEHKKQRKIFRYFGIPVLVLTVTGIILAFENLFYRRRGGIVSE